MAGWTIYGREAKEADKIELVAAGKRQDGTVIYLHPNGEIEQEAHVYTSQSGLQSALDAYQSRVDGGDIPEEQRPTGKSPRKGRVREDAENARSGSGSMPGPLAGLVDAVGGRRNAILLIVALAVAAYYADQKGYVDLGHQDALQGLSNGGNK